MMKLIEAEVEGLMSAKADRMQEDEQGVLLV
jgi:hypothetical protein